MRRRPRLNRPLTAISTTEQRRRAIWPRWTEATQYPCEHRTHQRPGGGTGGGVGRRERGAGRGARRWPRRRGRRLEPRSVCRRADGRPGAPPVRPDGVPAARYRPPDRRGDHRGGARPLRAPSPEHLEPRGGAALRAPGLPPARGHRALHARHGDERSAGKDRDMTTTKVQGTAHLQAIAPQFLVDDPETATAYYRDRLGFAVD